MIEKLGMRAAEFVGATATKVSKVAEDVAGTTPKRSRTRRVAKLGLPVVAATAAAIAAGASAVSRSGRGSGDAPTKQSGSGKAKKTAGPARAATNGAKKVTEQTREELYELAKKANIPGRASMTKEQLAKALSS